MRSTLRIPDRDVLGWVAYIAVALTIYAYFTLTSISLITYVLLISVLAFSLVNGTLGKIVSVKYFSYSVLLLIYVMFVGLLGPTTRSTMPQMIRYQMIMCLSFYIYVMADGKGINGVIFLISVAILILCVRILGDSALMETMKQASEEGVYYTYGENNRNTIGILLSIGALCMLHLGMIRHRSWYLGMALAVALGLMTGSRKVVLTVAAGAIIYVLLYSTYFQKKSKSKRQKTVFYVLIAVIAMIYACFEISTLYNIIGNRIEGFFGVLTGTGKTERSAEIRAEMVDKAMAMFKQKPILGWGINGFAMNSGFRVYSHNNYTETLVSFGLVGFVFMYAYKAVLLVAQYNLLKRESNSDRIPQHCVAFVLMSVCLVMDFTAISMNSVVTNMPFALGAAQLYYDRLERKGVL